MPGKIIITIMRRKRKEASSFHILYNYKRPTVV